MRTGNRLTFLVSRLGQCAEARAGLWSRVALFVIGAALVGACDPPPAPAPLPPTPVPQILVATSVVQFITFPTATPTPAPTLTLTPTLIPQITGLLGDWPLQIDYWVQGAGMADQIHYTGQGTLNIAKGQSQFTASGSIQWRVIARAGGCNANVSGGNLLTATLNGTVPLVADLPAVDLTITPDQHPVPLDVSVICTQANLNSDLSLPALTLPLAAAGQLSVKLPLHNGIIYQSVNSLASLTGGLQRGTLVTQIALSRPTGA